MLVPFFGGRRHSTRHTIIFRFSQHIGLTSFIVIILHQCSTMSKTSQPLSHSDIIMTINGMLSMLESEQSKRQSIRNGERRCRFPPTKKDIFSHNFAHDDTYSHHLSLLRLLFMAWPFRKRLLFSMHHVLVRTFINVSRSGKKRSSHQMMK